jgi:hypothetical protein
MYVLFLNTSDIGAGNWETFIAVVDTVETAIAVAKKYVKNNADYFLKKEARSFEWQINGAKKCLEFLECSSSLDDVNEAFSQLNKYSGEFSLKKTFLVTNENEYEC